MINTHFKLFIIHNYQNLQDQLSVFREVQEEFLVSADCELIQKFTWPKSIWPVWGSYESTEKRYILEYVG